MKQDLEICVFTTTECSDMVACFLQEQTQNAVSIYDVKDLDNCGWDYVEEGLREKFGEEVKVVAICPSEDYERVLQELKIELDNLQQIFGKEFCGSFNLTVNPAQKVDWLKEWQKNFEPVVVGDVCICPNWLEYNGECKNVLKIDSGIAFGTGYHETTSQCLLLAQNFDFCGKTVLDMGCGSGVLGLSALLLGAKHATLVDLDSQATEATETNAQYNELLDKCTIICGDLTEKVSGKFDFCFANLTADILKRLSKTLSNYLLDGAYISLSGILVTQQQEVITVFEELGFKLISFSNKGEWCALLMQYQPK
ncbi:MAG: 50S ribosomal protein L11 methyltransferase [Clostridia bacterium]|nr:50S ribosomal protein L11 methyltransferase [Clostridia bacterium]